MLNRLSAFVLLLIFHFQVGCKTVGNQGSLSNKNDENQGCTVHKKTAAFGSFLTVNNRFMYQVSNGIPVNRLKEVMSEAIDGDSCSSFLLTMVQDLDADVRKFVDQAAKLLPLGDLNQYGFGVVKAAFTGYNQYLKNEMGDQNDSFTVQRSLALVSGRLKNGKHFVAYTPLNSLLDLDPKIDLNWTVIVAPPETAYIAREVLANKTVRTKRYLMQHYTCADPGCRLTDIPAIMNECPSCGQPKLFGQSYYDTALNQAVEVSPDDFGTLAIATGEPDVGCRVCSATNPRSGVGKDKKLTCRVCESNEKPIYDLNQGKRRLEKLAKNGEVFIGSIKVGAKSSTPLSGSSVKAIDLAKKLDLDELVNSEHETGTTNFYSDFSETALSDSERLQESNGRTTSVSYPGSAKSLGFFKKTLGKVKKFIVPVAITALVVPLLAAGIKLGFRESVTQGVVLRNEVYTVQYVEEPYWAAQSGETSPLEGSGIRNIDRNVDMVDITERQIVDTIPGEWIDPPETCRLSDTGTGFKEEICDDPAPYKTADSDVYDDVKIGEEEVVTYTWEKKAWREVDHDKFLKPADADKDGKLDLIDYPDENDSTKIKRLLSQGNRLGRTHVEFNTVVKLDAGEAQDIPRSPQDVLELSEGTRVTVTSSFFKGKHIEKAEQ